MTKPPKERIYANFSLINKICSIVCASAHMKEISLPNEHKTRGNIHLVISGGIGLGKSTVLYMMADHLGIPVSSGISKANLLGSVDKNTGMFIEPSIWRCRNNAYMMDEIELPTNDKQDYNGLTKSFLALLENPIIDRKMGFRSNDFKKKDKDLYCIVKDNTISCKTRFSFIATTMFDPYRGWSKLRTAMVTRCLILEFNFSREDIFYILRNKHVFHIDPTPIPKDPKIDEKTYEELLFYVEKSPIPSDYIMRTVLDLCRFYAILGKHDNEIYDYIIDSRSEMLNKYKTNKKDINIS